MEQDYIKITFPKDPTIALVLEAMMDEAEVLSFETTNHDLSILDLWENRDSLNTRLKELLPNASWREEKIEDQDWDKTWIEGFQPIRIARKLWVLPPWHEEKIPEGHIKIIINPSNAFGTGTHESTFLALKLLFKMIKPKDKIMDMGCGSGILSIAAHKLGAGKIYACDLDEDIEHNITENLQLNKIDDIKWEIADVLEMEDYKCDLALINIQKHVILPLLLRFNIAKHRPNRVILAGLLRDHKKVICKALKEQGYTRLKIRRKNEWIAVSAVHRRKNEK
ncbi:MAG: 50S ribosomal protein L11 methyltransferase [Candidatus Neomarinimicrobiota bacterium]